MYQSDLQHDDIEGRFLYNPCLKDKLFDSYMTYDELCQRQNIRQPFSFDRYKIYYNPNVTSTINIARIIEITQHFDKDRRKYQHHHYAHLFC